MRTRVRCFCGRTTATLDSNHERASVTIFCPNCETRMTSVNTRALETGITHAPNPVSSDTEHFGFGETFKPLEES